MTAENAHHWPIVMLRNPSVAGVCLFVGDAYRLPLAKHHQSCRVGRCRSRTSRSTGFHTYSVAMITCGHILMSWNSQDLHITVRAFWEVITKWSDKYICVDSECCLRGALWFLEHTIYPRIGSTGSVGQFTRGQR